MDPEREKQEAHEMDMADQRREFAPLHGDGQPRTFIESIMDRNIYKVESLDELRKDIEELRRQLLLKQGEIDYLEGSAIPWLKRELDRERTRQWAKG